MIRCCSLSLISPSMQKKIKNHRVHLVQKGNWGMVWIGSCFAKECNHYLLHFLFEPCRRAASVRYYASVFCWIMWYHILPITKSWRRVERIYTMRCRETNFDVRACLCVWMSYSRQQLWLNYSGANFSPIFFKEVRYLICYNCVEYFGLL